MKSARRANFVSQSPAEAHFGLGSATAASEVRVVWPNGTSSTPATFAANQTASVDKAGRVVTAVPTVGTARLVILGLLFVTVALRFPGRG